MTASLKGGETGHDWEKDPEGGDDLQRLGARYGPKIRERLELFKWQELEPALRHEISRSYTPEQKRREAAQIGCLMKDSFALSREAQAQPPHEALGNCGNRHLDKWFFARRLGGHHGAN
jgi:hypothetical protein